MTSGELAVIEDVMGHPDSSVSDISHRTGFAQSHVSISVARLRQRGLVETSADPADGRRTRVRVADGAVAAITTRAGRDVHDAITHVVPDAEQARRVAALLDELARLLLRTRPTPAPAPAPAPALKRTATHRVTAPGGPR